MDKTIGLIKKCDNLELRQKNKAGYLNKVLAAYLRYWLGRETPAQRSLTNEKRKANEPPPPLFLSLKHTHTDMLSLSLYFVVLSLPKWVSQHRKMRWVWVVGGG